jgi:hypothetical protein
MIILVICSIILIFSILFKISDVEWRVKMLEEDREKEPHAGRK